MLSSFHGSVDCRNTTTNSFFCVRFGYGANAIIAVGRWVAAFCSPWSISTTDMAVDSAVLYGGREGDGNETIDMSQL